LGGEVVPGINIGLIRRIIYFGGVGGVGSVGDSDPFSESLGWDKCLDIIGILPLNWPHFSTKSVDA